MQAVHTANSNGKIRNAAGKLVAFYDAAQNLLWIDGIAHAFPAADITEAMEICGEKAPR